MFFGMRVKNIKNIYFIGGIFKLLIKSMMIAIYHQVKTLIDFSISELQIYYSMIEDFTN